MNPDQVIAGLDIGSAKTTAIIAEVAGEFPKHPSIKVLGVGSARTAGLRRGVVSDIEETTRSIQQAMEDAERMAGVQVEWVYAGIAGEHVQAMTSKGVVAVNGEEVTRADVERAHEQAGEREGDLAGSGATRAADALEERRARAAHVGQQPHERGVEPLEHRQVNAHATRVEREEAAVGVGGAQSSAGRHEGDRKILGDTHDESSRQLARNAHHAHLRVLGHAPFEGRGVIPHARGGVETEPGEDLIGLNVMRAVHFHPSHAKVGEAREQRR